MREGTKRNALMLTALVLGALVGGNTASAANLVAAIPSDYTHSQLGSITGSKVTTHVDAKASAGDLTGLNQDPALYPLWVNGEGDLYLRQYTYSTTDLLNSRLINGQGEWDDTSAPSGKITAVANAHAAAGYNGYVYATGYDNGKIGAATLEGTELKENTDNVVNLKEDIIKYTADGAAAGYTDATAMHGEGLITTDDGYLYAAVNVNKQGGYDDYDNGYLMQYKIGSDGKLTYSSYSRIGKNTDSVRINQYNNQFVLSAIGGYQNFGSGNADTAITINKVASPGKLNPTSTVIRKPDYAPYDFRDVKVLPNGTVYILTYNIGDGGSAINSKVYKTTMANLTNGNKEQWEEIISGSQEGWFGKLNAEYYTKRLWLEMGNTLSVYTDGSTTPAYTWESKDFSTDQQFYQFNSVAMIPSDRINGDLVQLTMYNPEGLTSSSESAMEIINPDTSLATPTRHIEITGVEAKDKGTYASETTDYSTYTFTKDEVVGVGITRTGDLKNNISADIYASDGNDITVNAGDHTLTLWANNYVSSPVGVYAGKGKSVTINAAQTNIVTSGYENGNSLTNAIWNDAAKDAASSITINGDTNIAMKGGYGGNGIAIQKTDRWGEASNETTQTSKITLNGDVVIAGENEDTWGIPANKENVYSRFNNSGILTSVDKSEVTVTGNAKLSVYGNGITTNAKDSKVSIGGGHIVVPKNTNYGYYTLGAYQGTINVNTGTTGNSPGANTVQLDGDIFALDTGTVNAALTTADSYLNGIVDNGGTANVWLQNGAEWFNAANNTRYKNDNEDVGAGGKSLVTKLVGGTSESTAGNIFQNDSNPLTIDNYSGYANIYYAHTSDGTNASDYAAGDTVIKKAASGSAVNMITANNGINMQDTDQVAGALNTLAGKLTYSGFGNGENNLTGKVKIADGLTASSAALKTGDIVFSDGTGKGTYVKSDDNEGGAITETTTLTNDYTATASEKNVQGSGSSMLISALYAGSSETASKEKPMVVDMNGHNLTLNAQGDGGVASAIVLGANQSIQIKNSDSKKQLTLKASHPDDTRAVNGIYVGGNNSSLTIDNPVVIEALSNTGRSGVVGINVLGGGSAGSDSAIDVIINGPLTIKGASSKNISAQTPANAGIKTVANGSAVTVNGSVDIEHVKGAALYTVGADSTISVAGGSITAEANPEHDKNYSAVRVDKGTVNLNMEEGQPGSNVTNVVGDFYLTKEYGKKVVEYSGGELIDFENSGVINAAFTTGDSSWTGAMTYIVDKDDYGSGGYTAHDAGNFNLWLQNGAIWNNEVQGGITPDESQRNTFNGSHVLNFTGGTEGHEGNIFQKDAKTLTIDNYSGSTNIFYAHTDDGTTADDYAAGDTIINKAATGSAVNMITDSSNITTTDDEQVAAVLNTLAGKLTYSGFASGEKNLTGKVKIADGLTASSAVLKTGDITFADDTGKGTYVKPVVPIEPKSEFSTAITGDKAVDTEYVHAGVLDDSNIYNFTEDKTTIDVETGYSIPGGPWMSKITALVSGKDDSHSVDVNMNGHDLTLRSSNSTVGIAAIGKGKVEVNNAGAIDIDVDTSGRAALYANGGGTIVVHNGGDNLENKVLKVRAEGSTPLNTAVIKTMNGVNNVHSSITIDGLVDVVADGETANEAVSAVASNIEIGGGHIEAKNGAWAAIRAYGEFVSQNYGIVNVNVAKDQNGNIIGSGENKTTIIGDIVTNGGMGTKGKISVGLNGKDSYWKGNYADTRGYGVTPGIEGAVNLYMGNGSHWLGFGNGTMNVNMSGKDTYWTGFSIARNNGLRLTLNDGAVWYNAFSKGQTDKDGNLTVSRVTNLSGNGGIIDMSGSKGIYVADSTSLSGSPTKAGASGFAKDDSKTETGNAFIEKYSGNHTVIYKDNSFIDDTEREHALLYGNKEAHIAGGTFTIFKADAGSAITLLTGNNGINTSADATYVEKNQLNDTLNKLAEKLFYTANDGNLSGKVGIASGLTSSAAYAVVKSGDITFKDKGQGSYVYDLVKPSEQAVNPIDKVIDGSKDSQNYYEDIGIYNKNKNSYNFTKTPSDITASDKTDGVVHAKDGNLNIKANDTINISAGDNGVGVAAENGKKVILSGITNITASKALDANGEESAINMEAGHVRGTVTAENGGKITMDGAEVTGDITVADEKSSLNGKFKGGNGIQGKVTNNGEAVLTFTEGANWTGNSAGTGSTNVDIDKGSVWTGASANKGTNLDLKGTWKQTGESAVGQVISDNGTLDKTDSSSGKTSIQKLSGELNVTYGHNESDPTRIIGGDTVVASAASGSKINLITDSKGLKLDSNRAAAKNQVSETLNQLAHKLTYTADDNNLEGKVKIAEGLTSASAAMKAENITFDKNGVGSFVYDSVKNGLDIEYGSEETQMMRGTKSALFGAAMMWRSNSNDLQRRMGDIRLGQEESGVWAKYIGGKNEFNSQSTYMNQSYDIAQAGYDRKAGDWTVGIALDHGTGDVHYTGGKGDEKMTTLAVYGTKVSDDGKYVDIIIKSGKVSNDFEVSNEIGNELSGDYDTWGSSLSAEFGKRFIKDNGFYLDPSVEFTISRLNGKSFTGHSDLGELAVRQHAFNSAIGRIGLGIGRQTAKSNLYAKASLAHEFGGNFRTDFSADDGGAKGTKIDLQDTWMDLELGGSYSLNKNVYLYANYTRSFGAEMSTEWRADVGVRYSF